MIIDEDEQIDQTDRLGDIDPDINHFNEIYPDLNDRDFCRYYDFHSLHERLAKSRSDLTVFHVNICSLGNEVDELFHTLNIIIFNFDFIFISESWIDNHVSLDILNVLKYTAFHQIRDGRGGGVSIYVNSSAVAERIKNLCFVDLDIG